MRSDQDGKIRAPNDKFMAKFLHNLQAKLQFAFSDAKDGFEFFDLNGSGTIKIEEFIFGVDLLVLKPRCLVKG
jgi:hypothetical protein